MRDQDKCSLGLMVELDKRYSGPRTEQDYNYTESNGEQIIFDLGLMREQDKCSLGPMEEQYNCFICRTNGKAG